MLIICKKIGSPDSSSDGRTDSWLHVVSVEAIVSVMVTSIEWPLTNHNVLQDIVPCTRASELIGGNVSEWMMLVSAVVARLDERIEVGKEEASGNKRYD